MDGTNYEALNVKLSPFPILILLGSNFDLSILILNIVVSEFLP